MPLVEGGGWDENLYTLGYIGKFSQERFGIPNCKEFQRLAFKQKVTVSCKDITLPSDAQRTVTELLSCLLLGMWPRHNKAINSKSPSIAFY